MKKKRKINIPAAKFGLDKLNGIVEALPGAITTMTNPFQTSTATTGGEAVVQSLADIGSGAASGAQLGMAIGGPMGAGIGAVAGAATGLIGKKGSQAEMASFTDYDEGTLGTGLIGAFTNKRLRKERRRIANNAYGNRAAVQGTANLQSEWNETMSAEYGGMIPESLVYADDGELIRTPYGDINKIPEKGKPTDSNLLSLPEGSRILSNTLKVPGTKKTFAEMGNKLINKRKSKYTDRYAENSQKLNDMNGQIAYDELFALQEEVKRKRGIKPKTKELVQAAQTGDVVKSRNQNNEGLKPYSNYTEIGTDAYSNKNMEQYLKNRQWLLINQNDPIAKSFLQDLNSGKFGDIGGNVLDWEDYTRLSLDGKKGPVHTGTQRFTIPEGSIPMNIKTYSIPRDYIEPLNLVDDSELKDIFDEALTPTLDKSDIVDPKKYKRNGAKGMSAMDVISSGLSGIASIAPALSNIFTSDPKPTEANYNPYANAILNTMGGRRYNIEPALRDIRRNRAINNYNVNQANTSTGANLAFALQSAINTDKAIANVRAQESNINNQYLGEYANAMNDLGQQWVNATNYAEDINRKAYANARNIRRQGISQLSGILQNRELMRNQRNRDNAMLTLYAPFLEAGFTQQDINNMLKYIRRGGNNVG